MHNAQHMMLTLVPVPEKEAVSPAFDVEEGTHSSRASSVLDHCKTWTYVP